MSEPRKVDFRAEYQLKTRTINLLRSSAARQVEFTCHGMYFSGSSFEGIAALITAEAIGFRTGHVPDNAGAAYRKKEDLIDVPDYDFGKDATNSYDRHALIHECVHAWYDVEMNDTTGLWEESIAYIAGALFTLYFEPRTGPGAAPTPSWVDKPVFAEAFRIALALMGKANPIVSIPDAASLEAAIRADDAYPNLNAHPETIYQNNGVTSH